AMIPAGPPPITAMSNVFVCSISPSADQAPLGGSFQGVRFLECIICGWTFRCVSAEQEAEASPPNFVNDADSQGGRGSPFRRPVALGERDRKLLLLCPLLGLQQESCGIVEATR